MEAASEEDVLLRLKVILCSAVQKEEIQKNPCQGSRLLVNEILQHYCCQNLLNKANRKML